MFLLDPIFHMWATIIFTVAAFYYLSKEKVPLELTAILLLTALLLFGQIFPLLGEGNDNLLSPQRLLAGFANPSLIAVLALLVMGQAMIHTAALTPVTKLFLRMDSRFAIFTLFLGFIFVTLVSAIMNNTPLVIITIPVMQALAMRLGKPDSRVMIPLSFAAILGGMMTLVGSSTNMLVSSALTDLGYEPFKFFDFTIPGAILAGAGMVYVLFILPRLLPDRSTMARDLAVEGRQFIAELVIGPGNKLIGATPENGSFDQLPDMTVRMVQRHGQLLLHPFQNYEIKEGDVIIVAATRETLTEFLASNPGYILSDEGNKDDSDSIEIDMGEKRHVLAEIMITPASRLIDQSLEQIDFEEKYKSIVLGIQRRAQVVRRRLGKVRLENGDVLLVTGSPQNIDQLKKNLDFIMLSGTKRDLPATKKAPVAIGVFLATIACAATGVLSISVAAVTGAVAMLAAGCISLRHATRAIDRKIFLLVGSALALGSSLQVSGAAIFIADLILTLPIAQDPFFAAAFLFLIVALATNLLTNNACAILFTPIALNLAAEISVDPFIFALTVVFAANCSFASPIGYQTNLLVMGPGHYQFKDFMRAGIPLIIWIWIVYCCLAKFYFNL